MKVENAKTFFSKHPTLAWGITLFFLPPVGAYGMWKYTSWVRWLKVIMSVYAAIWTLSVLAQAYTSENNQPVAEVRESSPVLTKPVEDIPEPVEDIPEPVVLAVKTEAEKFKEEVLREIKGWGALEVASKRNPEELLVGGKATCEPLNAGIPPEEFADYASHQVEPNIRKVIYDYTLGVATAAKYHLCNQ